MKSNEYLTFTKRERNGIISLVIILILVMILSRLCRREPDITNDLANLDTIRVLADSPAIKITDGRKGEHANVLYRQERPPPHYQKKLYQPVEINTADTSAFIALPGIGSKLAARIVLFREKLGGFCRIEQIAEVYGLQDSVFRKLQPLLRCDSVRIKKIDINSATKEELKTHPYIRWKLADAIVIYRSEHGTYSSMEDLYRIELIDEETARRIKPYINFK